MKLERHISYLLFLTVILISLTGCSQNKATTGARRGTEKVLVDALVVKPQLLLNKIYTTGTLIANEEVELRPEISGRVIGVYFEEGSHIKKGQLLLKINDADLKAQIKGKLLEEKLAADEEQRRRNLFERALISQEEYDKSLTTLKLKQAEREVIESQIAKTEIQAPFDGIVGLRYISEGGYVTTNMPVATMQDIDPMKVEFSVPEKYAREITGGTNVTVRIGDSQEEFKGVVYAIESKVDPGTRTIKARAKIPNRRETLIPGSFAKVELTLAEIPDALMVPAGSVIPELGGEKIYLCQNGAARAVSVKTGIRTETGVQITSGLAANDTLITTGLLQLGDGKAVQIGNLQSN